MNSAGATTLACWRGFAAVFAIFTLLGPLIGAVLIWIMVGPFVPGNPQNGPLQWGLVPSGARFGLPFAALAGLFVALAAFVFDRRSLAWALGVTTLATLIVFSVMMFGPIPRPGRIQITREVLLALVACLAPALIAGAICWRLSRRWLQG